MKNPIVRAIWPATRRRQHMLGAAILAATLAVPAVAFASAQISGSAQAVSVNAQNSSIKEILSTLSKQFNLRVRSSVDLDKQVAGTYQGSLPGVLGRLLAGYNFVIRTGEEGLEVTVFGGQNNPSTAHGQWTLDGTNATAQAPAPAQSILSRVGKPPNGQASSTRQTQPAPTGGSPPVAAQTKSAVSNQNKPSGFPTPSPSLKVAEGPMPVPNSSNVSGPVPRPGTVSMPTPKVSSASPSLMPIPTTSANAPVLPMPTSSTPFPGITPQTGSTAPGSPPAANGGSATSAAPIAPTPTTR